MALVMLPCDLPWWNAVQKHLTKLEKTKNTLELIEGMQKIHELCNVSLDPDEDSTDPHLFVGLLNFLDNDLTSEERSNFLNKTLPIIIKKALSIKQWKPRNGLHFSLQQQSDSTELDYNFVSSLIANAFFSTFPKRTEKTHPTLKDFNFTNFFKYLHTNSQKAKLKSILHYFDWLDVNEVNSYGYIKILRQVMSSKEWLTIEDWLECTLPLCPLQIRYEGKLERADKNVVRICFASPKVGGKVLENGNNQESMNLITFPEMLVVLLNVEALEDNEVLTIEKARNISKICDPKNRACIEKNDSPQQITLCCVDAEDYTKLPISQYEEDNILRELNKCLLAFQQKQSRNSEIILSTQQNHRQRRLSPIGESISSTPPELSNIPLITQQSCSTNKSYSESSNSANNKLKVKLLENSLDKRTTTNNESIFNNRRGKFIVLGSSGELLPVKRNPNASTYSSISSSDDEFHSAKTSLDDGSGDDDYDRRYSMDLETPERRYSFAQRLRDALRRETLGLSSSSESSYAVGISVTGSGLEDPDIQLRRGGSRGFMLQDESLDIDESVLKDSLQQEQRWIDKFRNKQTGLSKRDSNKSSDYSFSTEYSSELEEVYEQFSRWLEDPILETDKGTKRTLDSRDLAVVQFAGSLLKRTLSESFAGVPLTEGCGNALGCSADDTTITRKSKLVLNARSLSLELARQKHKLAAQLMKKKLPTNEPNKNIVRQERKKLRAISCIVGAIVQTLEDDCVNVQLPSQELSQIAQKSDNGLKIVATGNWGCGTSRSGEVQLKVILQWLAASVAGIPALMYYTMGHPQLSMLDTVCRLLVDRKWTVRDLTQATLRYSTHTLLGKTNNTLFEELIGVDKSA